MRETDTEVALLGIASRDDVPPMVDFVTQYGLDQLEDRFPQLADPSGELWARFGVRGQPSWAFVDDTGEVETVFGALSDEELSARLEALAAT